jgi:hypothetical protein
MSISLVISMKSDSYLQKYLLAFQALKRSKKDS